MILDRIENWALYFDRDSPVGRAMHYLTHEYDFASPDGRIDIEGDRMFALVQGYETLPPEGCRFEAHRKYLDIQYVYEGAEGMGWAAVNTLDVAVPYSDETDVGFFVTPQRYTTAEVFAGNFALFYPGDAHMPKLRVPGTDRVRKVVVKVLL